MDCINKQSCKTIRTDMIKRNFIVCYKTIAWEGDHYGVKEFRSKKAAKVEAKEIMKNYENKMYKITVNKID